MKKINCLIIDDERLSRKELTEMLSVHKEIHILAEAKNGQEAIDLIQTHQPDLIFLDIQMPGMNGFEVLENLNEIPKVVFVSAYDQYAIKAFDVSAVDYLMKPIDEKRLSGTIQKLINEGINKNDDSTSNKIEADKQIFLKDGDNCFFVKVSDIEYIESVGNYARLFFDNKKAMMKRSLTDLESRLPDQFFRCNRSQLINLSYIKKIDPMFKGTLRITMKGEQVIDVSERKSSLFKDKMSL